MVIHEFGNPAAEIVLIQAVDGHDLSGMENEIRSISSHSGLPFRLIALEVDRWNHDLSPWQAPAVFGREDFGGGAQNTLNAVKEICADRSRRYYVGGYSLAGLFALWAACETDLFRGVAAASPSVWFPGFSEYVNTHSIQSRVVYLSLGDREEKARNPILASSGDRIRALDRELRSRGMHCTLEWNEGNHFRDADLRTAKAFAWVLRCGEGPSECKEQ